MKTYTKYKANLTYRTENNATDSGAEMQYITQHCEIIILTC